MLSPLVGLIERFIKKRRTLVLALVYSALIGLLVLIGFQLIPAVAEQAVSLAQRLPDLITSGQVAKLPLPRFLEPVREQVMPVLMRAASNLESSAVPFLKDLGARLVSGLGELLPIILVPILAFFFLKDGRAIRNTVLELVTDPQRRATLDRILEGMNTVLRNYIRALVMVAVSSFSLWAIFLSLMKYPYELLLAGVCGVLEFIPVVGPLAALVTVLAVCVATGTSGLVWIIVFWAAVRLFQDYVLQPLLMSAGIELHPLLVLFGVLAGEKIAGIPGMFFSVPVVAILRVVYLQMRRHESGKMLGDYELPTTLTERAP